MRTFLQSTLGILVCCAAANLTTVAYGADVPLNQRTTEARSYRVSKLTGLGVRNNAGDKLGSIDDLVINMETGKVAYVALGVGGVLGVGEKLLAIPFSALKFNSHGDEMFFVLDMSKEKVKSAPGFDKHDWPNFADPNWSQHIDEYYRHASTTTTGTRVVTPK